MADRRGRFLQRSAILAAVFLGGFLLYLSTLAPSVVFGDPAEYTFVPHVWGVLHPPGYAFETLLVKFWQTVIPIGTIAYRTNLLSAFAGAVTLVLVFGGVRCVVGREGSRLPALFSALALAAASDFWQHAIHTNAHIVTAMLAALSLWSLLRWRATENRRWLHAFAFVAGLSVTHHPLLVFSFPAYGAFIISNLQSLAPSRPVGSRPEGAPTESPISDLQSLPGSRPESRPEGAPTNHQLPITNYQLPISNLQSLLSLITDYRLLLACLLGLLPWLYFPIRSSVGERPIIGPGDMNTLDGFLNLVLARGLTGVNLWHFGFHQQWQRAIVFWSILRLQFSLPVILLMPLGLAWLWRRNWRTALLFTLFLGVNLIFIFNTVQDVMAYFLAPLVGLAMCAGIGMAALMDRVASVKVSSVAMPGVKVSSVEVSGGKPSGLQFAIRNSQFVIALLFASPLLTLFHNYPRISLRENRAADQFVDSLFARFEGQAEGAILLSDWEHLTPVWYRQYVVGQSFDSADLTPVYVSGGADPWVENVWKHVEAGPIYVVEYQPQIVAEGFRLRADGTMYRVLPPGSRLEGAPTESLIPNLLSLIAGSRVEILGYDLGTTAAKAGDVIPFTLFLRAPQPVADVIFPYATLGPYRVDWTTDSHLLTPQWQPGEIIAERFDLTIPLDAPGGDYPLAIGMTNLTTGEALQISNYQLPITNYQLLITNIRVASDLSAPPPRVLDRLAANFGQRVGLEWAGAWVGGRWHSAPWDDPITARPGEAIQIFLQWRSLAPTETSAVVFLHLLDGGNGLWAGQDYTPLGGAFPTMLWFPKWIEGQTALDPYTLTIPRDAPPGDYYIEVGLYGLRTIQRWPVFDREGNSAGDRFVLGWVTVEK